MPVSMVLHLACAFIPIISGFVSDSQENIVDVDNTELLQTRVQPRIGKLAQKQKHKKIDLDQTVLSMNRKIDELEKHGSHQNPSGSWDQSTSLANFKSLIEEQLQVFIEAEHGEDQDEYNDRLQQSAHCGGAQRWETGGDVAVAKSERIRWQAKHQACRASEKAWHNYQTAGSSPSCASEGVISTEHEVLAAHANLASLVGAVQTRAASYDATAPMGKQSCALDQTLFEDHFCAWRTAHLYACSAAQDCAAQTGLSALRARLLERSENRRALWHSLELVLCRVQHLMGSMDDSTDVSDFNSTDICAESGGNASTLYLSMPTLASSACAAHSIDTILAPSTEDGTQCASFIQANYGWDQGEHVIPPVCRTSCPSTAYTAFAAPAECSNEPAECQFYNHHSDVCGSYDSETFVAGDVCCACGGGAAAIAAIEFLPSKDGELCPLGYAAVTDEQECRDYAANEKNAAGDDRVWNGVVTYSSHLLGCFHSLSDTGVWFNDATETTIVPSAWRNHNNVCRGDPSNNPYGGPGHKCPISVCR